MTSADEADQFPPEVVDAVVRHMTADHAEDSLRICRAFGAPDATSASMTGFDRLRATFRVVAGSEERELEVPWSTRLEERAQVRAEVVRLHEEAERRLASP